MKDNAVFPEDLGVLARHRELSAEQRLAFERRLGETPTDEIAFRTGLAFDRIAAVREGDEQRIQRCVERALRAKRGSRGPLRWGRHLWLSAALVLIAGTGLAYLGQAAFVRHQTAPPTSASATMVDTQLASDGRAKEPRVGSEEPRTQPSSVPSHSPAVPPATGGLPAAPPSDGPGEREGTGVPSTKAAFQLVAAADLLARANAARGAGRTGEAIELYSALQREYPSSAEARLSHVSLGRLWLARGRAGSALAEFDRYLGSGGPLAEEALAGRAQSLAALGRSEEERATYQQLLQRFPRSVYAIEARRRLGQGEQGQ
ncbi:MAG: tetratricopeptide repeat protein [Polyangiaceae bacterium]|nr:tetratricopeptide repeat protein [Polyangiaceae bacterium]